MSSKNVIFLGGFPYYASFTKASHNTIPKSSLQLHWISVRFYEKGDTSMLVRERECNWTLKNITSLKRSVAASETYHNYKDAIADQKKGL